MIPLLRQLFFIFLFFSCASNKLILPPTYDEMKKIKYDISKNHLPPIDEERNIQWTSKYLQADLLSANGANGLACQAFKELSEQKDFPLFELAFIKTLTACSYGPEELIKIWETAEDQVPGWLKELYLNVSLNLAAHLEMKEQIANFSFQLSKYGRVQHEKIRLINSALENTSDPKLSTKFRNRLYAISPRLNPIINNNNIEEVARDFEKSRMFDKARELYQNIIDGKNISFAKQIELMNRIAMSYKLERKLDAFRKKTGEISELINSKFQNTPQSEEYKNALISNEIKFARALWTSDNGEKAKKILLNILKHAPSNPNTRATILNSLGGISMEARDLELAIIYYKEALLSGDIGADLRDQLCWNVGWIYYHLKKFSNAQETFSSCQANSVSNSYRLKLKFWEARALHSSGNTDRAVDLFNELVLADEYGYYGIMAARELGLSYSPLEVENPPTAELIPTFEWLISVGEHTLASKFITNYNSKKRNPTDRLKIIPLLARAHAYDILIEEFYKLDDKIRGKVTGQYVKLLFPTPFLSISKKAADKFKIDSEFIHSIARQESSFNPVARSFADAFGIMQIIPERGAELSRRYNIPYTDFKSLFNESTNINMGAALLKELLAKYEGCMVLATASYNASESAINQWLRDRYNGDMVEFIEMIPYQETNHYVKIVLRNFINYKRIAADEEFEFPNKILQYKRQK
ncbi:MAG TPA: lytic transglycosylase domain-containing protein [Bacteriovoracaceae bacterium]|nr:lytic transglycosylase domain-containing protein [Bacteriovoracaceae bacterium]